MRCLALAAIGLQLLSACVTAPFQPIGSNFLGCCGDTIWRGEIRYAAHNEHYFFNYGRAITEGNLGPEQFRIRLTLADGYLPPGEQLDRAASMVPVGEPVYAVRGYATTFRLAARHDGRLVLYDVDMNPDAKTGADVLDLDGKVGSISLLSGPTKSRPEPIAIARISDPGRVGDLVRHVLAGPVSQSYLMSRSHALVAFELNDGTVTARWYARDPGAFTTFGGYRAGGYALFADGMFRSVVEDLCATDPPLCTINRGG